MEVDSSTSFGGAGEQREARLLRDALRGDRTAFCELIDVAAGTAFALIGIHLRDRAATRRVFLDLVAECFRTLAERDRSLRGWTWICRGALARAVDARAKDGFSGSGIMFARRDDPIARTVGELPPATGAMLHMRFGLGCSVLEIARVFEMTTNAVSQRLFDAVNALDRTARSLDAGERAALRPAVPEAASEDVSSECRGARRRLHLMRDRALESAVQIETREHLSRCQACLNTQSRLEFAEAALAAFLREVSPSPRRLRRFLRNEAENFPSAPKFRERLSAAAKRVGRRILRPGHHRRSSARNRRESDRAPGDSR